MKKPQELGDKLESILIKAGITKERLEEWLGQPCGCEERKRKLNLFSVWAKRLLLGKQDTSFEDLSQHF